MPMGTNQTNNIVHATLDVWEDVVYFNAKSYPAGYFATEILNIYRLFSTRTNTIRKHAERKKIDAETRAVALELAREYRDRALMDREYFLNGYAGDMELENIYTEAKKRLS